jgi:hypothetical protein
VHVTLQQLVSQLFERGNAMQSFWGFYITVSIGLIAFFGSSRRPILLAILVSIAFVGFATVNVSGMSDIARQRMFLWQQLESFGTATTSTEGVLEGRDFVIGLKKISQPPNPTGVIVFHIICDVAVLAAIWALTLLGQKVQ